MNFEASAASQSQSSARSEARSSSEGFISQHFDPFFDFFTQFIHPYTIFYFVYLVIFAFQMVYTSMWIHHTNFWIHLNEDMKTHSLSDLAKAIHYIAPFSPIYKSPDDYLIPFVVFSVIVLLIIFTIIFQLWFYKSQRRFSKFTLYPTRIIIELITPIMLVPIAHITGHALSDITSSDKEKAPQMYVYFAVGLIEYIICFCIFFYSCSIIGVSAFMSVSPLAVFDYRPYLFMIISTSVFSFFESIFLIFPSWISHPLVVFHIVVIIYVIYLLTYQPFVFAKWNCFFMTFAVFGFLLDILKLATNFFNIGDLVKNKSNYNSIILIVNLVVFLALLIVAIILSIVFSVLRFKKIKKILNPSSTDEGEENKDKAMRTKITDEEKVEIFTNLKLDHNESMALSILYYVTQNRVVPYLDFCLIKFILNSHKSVNAIMQCMRLISYFPCNSRHLNMLFNVLIKRRDTKFTHRFFIYQIQKIKTLRQSSNSLIALEKLNELNENTSEIEQEVFNFWLLNPNPNQFKKCSLFKSCNSSVDVTYLYQLQNRIKTTRSLWDEALVDFPNSIPYREEFCHFSIECQTDFATAIKSKHKSDMIESGRSYSVDMCFRLFVKNFPDYLKKKVIDVKGNFIKDSKKPKGGNSSVGSTHSNKNSFNSSNSSSSAMIDGAVEEEIGRSLIRNSRIRLAMQKSTETKKAGKLAPLTFVTIFLFLLGLFCAFFIYLYFKDYFASRTRSMTRIELVNKIQLYTYTSAVMMLYKWGNFTDVIKIDSFINELQKKDSYNKDPIYLPKMTYNDNLVYFNVQARDSFRDFLIDVSLLSEEGVDVFKYGKTLFSSTTPLYFCNSTDVISPYLTNLKTCLLFIFMSESQVANLENETLLDEMFESSQDYCHILVNLMNIYNSFQETRDLLIELDEKVSNDESKTIYVIKLSLAIIYAILTVSLSCTFFFLYIHEIMHFVKLLLNLPREAKLDAMKPLRKYTSDDSKQQNDHFIHEDNKMMVNIHSEPEKKGKFSIPLVFCFTIFICFMVNIVLTYFQLENVQSYNKKYFNLNNWILNSRFRKVLVIRLTDWIMHSILADNEKIKNSFFINKGDFDFLIDKNFQELEDCSHKMLQGTDKFPSSNGEDTEIDKLTYQEVCQSNESDPSYHELYRCGSLRNLLTFYTNSVKEMIVNNKENAYNSTIDSSVDEVPAQVLHLATDHAIPRLNRIDERWDAISHNYNKTFIKIHTIFLCCSLIIVVFAFALMIRLTIILNHAYNLCLGLLRRVSPVAVINDIELVDYLLDKDEEKDDSNNSTDQGIIKSSQDAILCLSSTGMIEIVNPSVNHLFGFTPEQLIGQPVSTSLFDEKNGSMVNNQIFLMLNKQSSLTYEGHVTCLTDNETEVPCQIIIFGMTSDKDIGLESDDDDMDSEDDDDKKKKKNEIKGNIESFVIILRDETEILHRQQIAEEAKKQSETLLYQILPRSIVIRLNQGEKDISFSVPSATIMFIDIVKFSEYAVTLTPQEIMGNLSQIMGGYDDLIQKYDMLLKIKLIGDVYMCAGGLFNEDEPPVSHAKQMTRFALDALLNIEDMNVKLSALLSVRIGINTGGPLIAGVLGTDKPTFDIIGDPINIASRLQSTDFPGKIQISQDTYDLIKDLDFSIEPRGEVYLKGKGNQPAYIVSPSSGINFSLSQMSEDNISNTTN